MSIVVKDYRHIKNDINYSQFILNMKSFNIKIEAARFLTVAAFKLKA